MTFLACLMIQYVMNHWNITGRSLRNRKQRSESTERPILHLQQLKSRHSNTGNANILDTKEIDDILRSLSLDSNEMAKVYTSATEFIVRRSSESQAT